MGFVRVGGLAAVTVWLDQLVEVHEVSMIGRLVILRIGVQASDLVALKLDPALLLHVVRKCRLDLDHFFKTKNDLRCLPSCIHAALKAIKIKDKKLNK